MCTMTWFVNDSADGYELFFNRDEQKTRSLAEIPQLHTSKQGTEFVAPTDTQAGGTWILVNQYGVSVCLLNHYQFQQIETYKDWRSRGEIVHGFANVSDIHQVRSVFKSLDLEDFRAFRLFVIDRAGKNRFCVWDGHEPHIELNVTAPKTSSAVDAQKVKAHRHELYNTLDLANSKSVQDFYAYHSSHGSGEPEQGSGESEKGSGRSVCMHRTDGHTVSFTHISVKADQARVFYSEGSPCSNKIELRQSIELEAPVQAAKMKSIALHGL